MQGGREHAMFETHDMEGIYNSRNTFASMAEVVDHLNDTLGELAFLYDAEKMAEEITEQRGTELVITASFDEFCRVSANH